MNHSNYILTGDIQTGKSQRLMQWASDKALDGFITPTVEGIKHLYHIKSKTFTTYELSEKEKKSISIGRFFLAAEAFEISGKIIKNAIQDQSSVFIFDEIGRLELDEKGHYQNFNYLLKHYDGSIIVVVRQSLLNEVIDKFGLTDFKIVENINEIVL